MISAPERTTETQITDIQIAELATQETVFAEPRVRTHGHLVLVNWAVPAEALAPTIAVKPQYLKPQYLKDPVCKTAADRWFERSVFLLMASSVAAIGACFLHL